MARTAYVSGRRVAAWLRVARDLRRFQAMSRVSRPAMVANWSDRLFMLDDQSAETPFDRHYVYHPAWALRHLAARQPASHVDVSSSVHFIAAASAIVPVLHLDYRPPRLTLPNLECRRGDLMSLPMATASVASLSCMHVLEHVGLGRYGDPLDPDGDLRAAAELSRVLRPGGHLYFVVPVGRPHVRFNGHRVYDSASVRGMFPELKLLSTALVPDDAEVGLIEDSPPAMIDAQRYGCGCFLFTRPHS